MAHQNAKQVMGKGSLLGRPHTLSVETLVEQRHNGSSDVLFNLVAGTGIHWFNYRGVWMQVIVVVT
jgi:mitochondrial chaperone BCS1